MAQKRKNDGELPENLSCKKKQKTKAKANFIFSAIFSSLLSFITKNFFFVNLGKKTSIHQLDVVDSVQFPEEILVNILIRLPVWSLVRFKCVSKFWTTLISDPYFTMKHLNRAKNDDYSQKLLIKQRCPKDLIYSLYCCPLSPVQPVKDVEKLKLDCPTTLKLRDCIIHCCYNGLAIIEICDHNQFIHLLWNPSIRESIVLPRPGYPRYRGSRFGLGYDSSSGGYKILHMHKHTHRHKFPIEILALKGGSWRNIDEHPRADRRWIYAMDYLPFIHAAFHWIEVSRNLFVMFSFNISNEVYGEIPLSEEIVSLTPGPYNVGISVLEGMLCAHSNSFFTGKATFKVWILKEYGVKESWTPLFTIVKDIKYFNSSPRYRFVDGEVLFWCVNLETIAHAFRTVNKPFRSWSRWLTRGHAIRTVDRPFRSWPRCDYSQGGLVFTESLISPKSLTY